MFKKLKSIVSSIVSPVLKFGGGISGNKLGLKTKNIDQIIADAESIPFTLIDYRNTYGGMMFHELISLCKIIRYKQPNTVFEIGTYI